MKKLKFINPINEQNVRSFLNAAVLSLLVIPSVLWANDQGFNDTQESMCGFLGNINSLLSIGSIAVVTIAIIFAGYQIAFAHKRISEVAPILIGGLLIGAAGQIAAMVIGGSNQCSSTTDGGGTTTGGMAMLAQYLAPYA